MYERSAIVLERFFANLLGLNKVNNLKKNFYNYCELFEKFKVSQKANSEEFAALKEFQDAENEIEDIQGHEEKLYKKNAKLEYSRDLIFQDFSQSPEEIERCSKKIETDIVKGQEKLISLREEFVEAVRDYNDKKSILAKCKKARKSAEIDYSTIFEETKNNIERIAPEYIAMAKEFGQLELEDEIIETLSANGKDEKIPFNNQVITNAAKIGYEIAEKEVSCYKQAYNLVQKLINELLAGAVSMELHEKAIKNITVELSFLAAEKEYLIGFLDYERITVIYGKRMHRTLMMDACEKLEKDMEQVGNLYKLLAKEIAEKPTKKAYRELYNKSYLMEMEDKDAKFKKEKNRVNLSTGTVMNSNYWRIEGIKNIYTVFYKNIVEVFGEDLDEFEIPEEQDDNYDEDSAIGNENLEELETRIDIALDDIEDFEKTDSDTKVKVAKAESVEQIEEVTLEVKPEQIEEAIPKVKPEQIEEAIPKVKPEQKEEAVPKVKPEQIEETVLENTTEAIKESEKKRKVYTAKAKITPKKKEEKVVTFKEEPEEYVEEEPKIEENIDEQIDNVEEEIKGFKRTLKLAKIVKKRGRKKVRHYTRQIIQIDEPEKIKSDVVEISEEPTEEIDIFGEKYKDIDSKIAELDDLEEYMNDEELEDEISNIASDSIIDDENEESIFEVMEEEKDRNLDLTEIEFDEKPKKKSKNKLFSGLKKLNSKAKKNLVEE